VVSFDSDVAGVMNGLDASRRAAWRAYYEEKEKNETLRAEAMQLRWEADWDRGARRERWAMAQALRTVSVLAPRHVELWIMAVLRQSEAGRVVAGNPTYDEEWQAIQLLQALSPAYQARRHR
jgi:hypothetical protein